MFVTNSSANTVTVYTRTASGSATPLRTLQGAATGLSLPTGVAVDRVNDELVVANAGTTAITVYELTASGNVVFCVMGGVQHVGPASCNSYTI